MTRRRPPPLARHPVRNEDPKAPLSLPVIGRWTPRGPHRRPSSRGRSPTSCSSHRNSSSTRCCDDRVNPPNTPPPRSTSSPRKTVSDGAWDGPGSVGTTPPQNRSSPPLRMKCTTGNLSPPEPGPDSLSPNTSRCSTTAAGCIYSWLPHPGRSLHRLPDRDNHRDMTNHADPSRILDTAQYGIRSRCVAQLPAER